MEAILSGEPADWAQPFAEWNMTLGQAAVWLCSHDTYHLAQIRNMGIQALKRPHCALETDVQLYS